MNPNNLTIIVTLIPHKVLIIFIKICDTYNTQSKNKWYIKRVVNYVGW